MPMTKFRQFFANRQVVVSLVVIAAALMAHFAVSFATEMRKGSWINGIGNAAMVLFCIAFIGFLTGSRR